MFDSEPMFLWRCNLMKAFFYKCTTKGLQDFQNGGARFYSKGAKIQA